MKRLLLPALVAGALAASVAGCDLPQVPRDNRPSFDPADLEWVCAQYPLKGSSNGQVTFADVQRSLCIAITFRNRPPNFTELETAAVSEARRCDGGRAFELLKGSPPSQTVRELYERLKQPATSDGEPEACMTEAMLQGLVRSLGADYSFEAIDGPPQPLPDPIAAPVVLAEGVVYLRFPSILTGARSIVEGALRATRRDHAIVGLMLDIRGCDGAPLDDLVQFLSLFIDSGPVLQYRSRVDGTVVRRPAIPGGPAETLPLIVLVDERTQGGAEAFAAELRARGRALLIGRRTAGKATIQSVVELPSGSHLLIPVADLYEPGVGNISSRGVAPDLDIPATSTAVDHPDPSQAIALGARLLSTARSKDRAGLLEATSRSSPAGVR